MRTREDGPNAVETSTLRDYQWEGVRFLLSCKSALLADEMGLGKTVQVSVALSLLYKEKRLLVVR